MNHDNNSSSNSHSDQISKLCNGSSVENPNKQNPKLSEIVSFNNGIGNGFSFVDEESNKNDVWFQTMKKECFISRVG